MKIRVKVLALGFALACLAAGICYAPRISEANETSLGEIARQLKAQRAKARKPVWVVTNDNIAGLIDAVSGFGASSKGIRSADSAELAARAVPPPQNPPGTSVSAQPGTRSSSAWENPSAPPPGANPGADSLGFVQMADGKVETVVADGESVRLVPQTPTVTMAQVALPGDSPAGASPPQISTIPAAAVISTRGVTPDIPVHPRERSTPPLSTAIAHASYQVPIPAPGPAEASAPGRLGLGLAGPAAGSMNGATNSAAPTIAQKPSGSTDRLTKHSVSIKPLGFVVKGNGEIAAVLSQDDEIYIVRQGDRFAGRYRAVSVSADAVEAVEELPTQAPPPSFAAPPGLLSASAQPGHPEVSNADCFVCNSNESGQVSQKLPDDVPSELVSYPPKNPKARQAQAHSIRWPWQRSAHSFKQTTATADNNTVVFQTLGYVETQDGDLQAVVAEGNEVYLVKQGDTFADEYRATSVDPLLVLAVKVSPGQHAGNFLSAQTESGGKPASNKLYGYLHYPVLGWAKAQTFHEADASGSSVLTDLGVNLLKSPLAGYDF